MATVFTEIGTTLKMSQQLARPFGGITVAEWNMPEQSFSNGSFLPIVIDDVWSGVLALSSGALTIDLTALSRTAQGQASLNLTGKKIVAYQIQNLGANPMTFVVGAATGYAMFTSGGVIVGPSGVASQVTIAGFGAVGASNKNIDVTGTGTQTFRLGIVAGT